VSVVLFCLGFVFCCCVFEFEFKVFESGLTGFFLYFFFVVCWVWCVGWVVLGCVLCLFVCFGLAGV